MTLDPKKVSDLESDLTNLKGDLSKVAQVNYQKGDAIVSLICNVNKTSQILQRVFGVFAKEGINVSMMSQGASKTNISLVVPGAVGQRAVQLLHNEFFSSS